MITLKFSGYGMSRGLNSVSDMVFEIAVCSRCQEKEISTFCVEWLDGTCEMVSNQSFHWECIN